MLTNSIETLVSEVKALYVKLAEREKNATKAYVHIGARIRLRAEVTNTSARAIAKELTNLEGSFGLSTLQLAVQCSTAYDRCHGIVNFPVREVRKFFSAIGKGNASIIDALNSGILPSVTKKPATLTPGRAAKMVLSIIKALGEDGLRVAVSDARALLDVSEIEFPEDDDLPTFEEDDTTENTGTNG